MDKPYSAACERNQQPIDTVLRKFIDTEQRHLLEVGSGTGQHAVYMAPHFPDLTWVTSDLVTNHPGIRAWLDEANLPNISGPIAFEVGKDDFPAGDFNIVYTANTFHIMSLSHVCLLIKLCGTHLKKGSLFIVYGPFKYQGNYTSNSNADFDKYLLSRDPSSAIRDFEVIRDNFSQQGFILLDDVDMPANNQLLIFQKS